MAEKDIQVLCDIHHSPMELIQYGWRYPDHENVSTFVHCLECDRHFSPLQGYVDINREKGMDASNRRKKQCPEECRGVQWHGSMAIIAVQDGGEFVWQCLHKTCRQAA